MKERLLFFLVILNCIILNVHGVTGDSTRVSLLTVYPRSSQVYTLFGHTALRICDPSEKTDLVFNYGMFDSSRPNFIYHFVKGETDYMLGVDEFRYFQFAYHADNATVTEQELNLPSSEKERLWEMLINNARPENRVYRYSYFFDNCTTRPRDIIENFCGGELVYPLQEKPTTFRTLVHECSAEFPWLTFGIDLLIGNGADSIIGLRQEMFLPVKLMEAEDKAIIRPDSLAEKPLVLSTNTLITSDPQNNGNSSFGLSPMTAGILLLSLTLFLAVYGLIRKLRFRFFFGLLFLFAAGTGCIVAFVAFISTHPCTWPNWNLIWIHPLYFISFVSVFFKKTYPVTQWFHATIFVFLCLSLILWKVIPQEMNPAFIPYILCLGVSSLFHLIPGKK